MGIVNGKTEKNIGTLWRAAYLFDAAYIFTVGARYRRQASDTPLTPKQIPLFEFTDMDDLLGHLPYGCPLVGVEQDPRALDLSEFTHPQQACYLLGAEDYGLTPEVLDRCHFIVEMSTPNPGSMNVATAGALVISNRFQTLRGGMTSVEVAS